MLFVLRQAQPDILNQPNIFIIKKLPKLLIKIGIIEQPSLLAQKL